MSEQEIPYGYCHCGCGQKTKTHTRSHTRLNQIKGEPMLFVDRHQSRIPIQKRFWEKVNIKSDDSCWEWESNIGTGGYGIVMENGRQLKAHRVSYELTYGSIPDGLCVCHKCDNPPCVNPSHLFLGTIAENMRDMDNKGRRTKKRAVGSKVHTAKLVENDVIKIKEMISNSVPCTEIAKLFGVHKQIVYCIKYGKTWKHVK